VTAILAFLALLAITQPTADLRIVVVEGEDAVNVIQQKTAVAPVIEVRDRNNLPIAGVSVTFTISGNTASFAGGAQTLTMVTNTAGRAAVAALNPVASGAVQINVAAAFQGQTAIATIAQTNVLTAAQAATAAGASASGAGASGGTAGGSTGGTTTAAGGAAGGGGGISGTTIALVSAAVAGGAVAATKVAGGDETRGTTYTASYSASIPMTSFSPTGTAQCTFIESATGTVTITIEDPITAVGTAEVTEQSAVTGGSCGNLGNSANDTARGPLSGGPANLTFAVQSTNPLSNGARRTKPWRFSGQLNGNEITGVLTTGDINDAPNGAQVRGSVPVPMTLRPR
jgi:hypothetical protein